MLFSLTRVLASGPGHPFEAPFRRAPSRYLPPALGDRGTEISRCEILGGVPSRDVDLPERSVRRVEPRPEAEPPVGKSSRALADWVCLKGSGLGSWV